MIAIKGLFDGKNVKLLETQLPDKPQEVIVTFLGNDSDNLQPAIYTIAEQGHSFDFLSNEEEIYSDADLRIRY